MRDRGSWVEGEGPGAVGVEEGTNFQTVAMFVCNMHDVSEFRLSLADAHDCCKSYAACTHTSSPASNRTRLDQAVAKCCAGLAQ